MALALLLGWLLGYLGSIPAAGPLAMLVAGAALEGRRRRLVALAVGGATAEALWALGAAGGSGWIFSAHPSLERALRVGGGVLVLALGLVMMLMPAPAASPVRERASSSLLVGFLLVALNPSFLATWLAFCALLRAHPALAPAADAAVAPALAVGAAAGIVGWFLTLGALVTRHRERLSAWQRRLARGLGGALVVAGLVGLVRAAGG